MSLERATIISIDKQFEVEAYVWNFPNRDDVFQVQRLHFRGLDFPNEASKEGLALRKYLFNLIKNVRTFAIKKYGKNSFVRYRTEFFYLPGNSEEKNLKTIVKNGRSLNKELLKLGLAKPYNYKIRRIDFSKRRIKVKDKEIHLVTSNFKAEVCMYINDCKQYLRSAIERKPVDMMKGEFDPTDEEFLIIYGLKELKDMCMRVAGMRGLDWKGN